MLRLCSRSALFSARIRGRMDVAWPTVDEYAFCILPRRIRRRFRVHNEGEFYEIVRPYAVIQFSVMNSRRLTKVFHDVARLRIYEAGSRSFCGETELRLFLLPAGHFSPRVDRATVPPSHKFSLRFYYVTGSSV